MLQMEMCIIPMLGFIVVQCETTCYWENSHVNYYNETFLDEFTFSTESTDVQIHDAKWVSKHGRIICFLLTAAKMGY